MSWIKYTRWWKKRLLYTAYSIQVDRLCTVQVSAFMHSMYYDNIIHLFIIPLYSFCHKLYVPFNFPINSNLIYTNSTKLTNWSLFLLWLVTNHLSKASIHSVQCISYRHICYIGHFSIQLINDAEILNRSKHMNTLQDFKVHFDQRFHHFCFFARISQAVSQMHRTSSRQYKSYYRIYQQVKMDHPIQACYFPL